MIMVVGAVLCCDWWYCYICTVLWLVIVLWYAMISVGVVVCYDCDGVVLCYDFDGVIL